MAGSVICEFYKFMKPEKMNRYFNYLKEGFETFMWDMGSNDETLDKFCEKINDWLDDYAKNSYDGPGQAGE